MLVRPAVEDNSSVQVETEIAIYAKIGNFEGLKEASKVIQQHQVEGQFSTGVRCRVRKETIGDQTDYVFTTKVLNHVSDSGAVSRNEYSIPVEESFFTMFTNNIATKMLLKERYEFNSTNVSVQLNLPGQTEPTVIEAPAIKYEVDVYTKSDNTKSNWCKIDVELDDLIKFINEKHPELRGNYSVNVKVSHLPFQPSETMLGSSKDPKEMATMSQIWDGEWNLKPNPQKAA
jgi:hypothetical protein